MKVSLDIKLRILAQTIANNNFVRTIVTIMFEIFAALLSGCIIVIIFGPSAFYERLIPLYQYVNTILIGSASFVAIIIFIAAVLSIHNDYLENIRAIE